MKIDSTVMMTVIWQSMTTIMKKTLLAGESMKDQAEPVRAIIENMNTLIENVETCVFEWLRKSNNNEIYASN